MKLRNLLLCVIMLPTLATAEVYKWKDKNGEVRYSDVPPPANVKQESYGKKTVKPTGLAPLAAVEGDATAAMNKDKEATSKVKAAADKTAVDAKKADKAPLTKEEAAAKRAKDAEDAKKADEAKQAELKLKQENCKGARENLATYTNGGRISKTNENGQKQYLSDADIGQGKADAQKDVDKYCE
jgi:Domain of unknown function (DUF4124)